LEEGSYVHHALVHNVANGVECKAGGNGVFVAYAQALEYVRTCKDKEFENVPHLASKFKGALHAFHRRHIRVARHIAENE
tara:strand:- start:13272 stop:13511 length:240 start_codon:yes stop_codon:yes gene_type:complete